MVHARNPRIFTTMLVARVPGCLCSGPHGPKNALPQAQPTPRRSGSRKDGPIPRADWRPQRDVGESPPAGFNVPDAAVASHPLSHSGFAQGSCGRDPIRERRYDNGIENIVSIGFLAEVMQRIGWSYAGILTIASSVKRIRRIFRDARKSSAPDCGRGPTSSTGCSLIRNLGRHTIGSALDAEHRRTGTRNTSEVCRTWPRNRHRNDIKVLANESRERMYERDRLAHERRSHHQRRSGTMLA